MDKVNRNIFLQYIRARVINENLLVRLLGTNKPTDTLINKYIKEEIKRLPVHNSEKGKGIVNILNGTTKKSNEDTLNFVATLFKITPINLREFTKMWLDKKITETDLVINSIIETEEGIENQLNEKVVTEESNTQENDSTQIKQTNVLSAFNSSKIKKIKGKISQLNFLGFNNKQEVEGEND